MANKVHLAEWKDEGEKIKLIYKDGDSFYISREDFNRAFGCIVSGEKEEIRRDFSLTK